MYQKHLLTYLHITYINNQINILCHSVQYILYIYINIQHNLNHKQNTKKMRIFLTTADDIGTLKKTRITLVDCNTTNQLLKRIASECHIQQHWLIVKIKQQIINIRIIQGWPIQIYPIKQGSQLIVDVLPQGIKCKSPVSTSSGKLLQIQQELQLEIQDNNTTRLADQKLSFYSDSIQNDWTKYFQESLQKFLDAVRRQSIQDVASILKSQPQCNDDKVLTRIMNKKTVFLLNQTGQCGRTALHWAIQQKNLDLVQFLLIKSCDPNVVSIDQYTPLQLSIVLRASSIFQTLVSHPKIDLNKVTKKGTALHLCLENSIIDYAKKLLDCGANPQTQNQQGVTVVQLAQKLKIKGLKFKKTDQVLTQIPFILRGDIFKVSSFASRLKQRFLLVNPFTNQFVLYQQKIIQRNISITDIKEITQLKQKDKSWSMKKQFFYFFIGALDLQYTFCVRHAEIGKRWVEDIRKCVNFCNKMKQKCNISIDQQLIQNLDDNTKTVKVHKRKPNNQNTKKDKNQSPKLQLLKLKPMEEQTPSPNKNNLKQNSSPTTSTFQNKQIYQRKQQILLSKQAIQQTQITRRQQKSQPITIVYNSQQNQPDYLRESALLGSIINSQLLSTSMFGRASTMRQSLADKLQYRPIVCYKDFQVLRQLGNGSFGKVFLARHKKHEKLLALKVLNKKKLMAKKQLKYAVGQANILKKVQNPFIIKLHYSFQTPTNLYIALDYCPNGDLSQLMTQQQKFSQKVAKFYIAQIILAIEYLHKNKILYRDLKPQNILLGQDGFIRLTDFNLSKQNTFSMSFCGSPAYLSPEMLEKKGVGIQTDIYGIGCVLYEMLVGEPPYFDDNIESLYQNIRSGKLKFPSGISKQAKSITSGLLQRNISKRLGVKNMSQIKNHEFFQGFNWQQLTKLQMKIPLQLQHKIQEKPIGLEVIQQHGFQDADYQSSSSMINRIKNFTFVRDN